MKEMQIYTDGSCLGNPGPGGYAAVLEYKNHIKEVSGGFSTTTNNRMELLAAIEGLKHLNEPCKITLTTDSQYVKQGINQWIHNWRKNGWRTSNKKAVKNADLWKQLDEQVKRHTIQWRWVKGHSGHPQNERCDDLAREAANQSNLPPDKGYDSSL